MNGILKEKNKLPDYLIPMLADSIVSHAEHIYNLEATQDRIINAGSDDAATATEIVTLLNSSLTLIEKFYSYIFIALGYEEGSEAYAKLEEALSKLDFIDFEHVAEAIKEGL